MSSIWTKPPGEPGFGVIAGQSQAQALYGYADPPANNSNVYDYGTTGTGPLGWRNVDYSDNTTKADFDYTLPYTGHPGNRRGSVALSCAELIQEVQGRDQHVVQDWRGGSPIQFWAENAGTEQEFDLYTRLNSVVNAALATPELSSLSAPDWVIWYHGESNTGLTTQEEYYLTPQQYSDAWHTWRTNFEAAIGAPAGHIQYYLPEIIRNGQFTDLSADGTFDNFNTPWHWYGIEQTVADATDGNVHIISASGMEHPPLDKFHYYSDSLRTMGRRIGNKILWGESMAQTVLISAQTDQADSEDINLAEGQTLTIKATNPLVNSEQVILLQTTDDGANFEPITGAANNHGVILDKDNNRGDITATGGDETFRIRKTLTSSSTAVVHV